MSNARKVVIKTGIIVSVLSVNGGWTQIKDSDGLESKVRNSALRDLTEMELSLITGKQPKPAKLAKAAKPAAKKPARGVVNAKPETDDVLTGDGAARADKLVKPDYGRYIKHDTRSPSGRKALDIGDEAAAILRGQHIDDCYFIVAKNLAKADGVTDDDKIAAIEAKLKEQYNHLNVGMQRMNLGNRLRKALGTYGNLNAHKGKAEEYEPTAQELADDAATGGLKYGKRAGEKLKRATDPVNHAV